MRRSMRISRPSTTRPPARGRCYRALSTGSRVESSRCHPLAVLLVDASAIDSREPLVSTRRSIVRLAAPAALLALALTACTGGADKHPSAGTSSSHPSKAALSSPSPASGGDVGAGEVTTGAMKDRGHHRHTPDDSREASGRGSCALHGPPCTIPCPVHLLVHDPRALQPGPGFLPRRGFVNCY